MSASALLAENERFVARFREVLAERDVLAAERDALAQQLAKVEALVTDGGDYHHYVVDGPDGEYVQEGQPCIPVDDLRAALGGEDA